MQELSRSGFELRDFLHEGNGDIWLAADRGASGGAATCWHGWRATPPDFWTGSRACVKEPDPVSALQKLILKVATYVQPPRSIFPAENCSLTGSSPIPPW